MEIMRASIRDLGPLGRLERACFDQDAWSFLDLVAVLTVPTVVRLKAMDGNEMIGFVAGDPRSSLGWAWIATVGVHPRFRRKGTGRALLRACEARLSLPLIKLTVRPSNTTAVAMYESEGYETIDVWERYYRDGEDGAVMQKEMPAAGAPATHSDPAGTQAT